MEEATIVGESLAAFAMIVDCLATLPIPGEFLGGFIINAVRKVRAWADRAILFARIKRSLLRTL